MVGKVQHGLGRVVTTMSGSVRRATRRVIALYNTLSSSLRLAIVIVWPIQVVSSVLFVVVFGYVWAISGIEKQPIESVVRYATSLLPVFAITNAIPLLGVSSYLVRANANDKTIDALERLFDLVGKNTEWLEGYSRSGAYGRVSIYKHILSWPKLGHFVYSPTSGEMIYTPRPYWDGVWYYGKLAGTRRPLAAASTHEVVYCARMALMHVRRLRRTSATLVWSGGRGGTQGSQWFLDEFRRRRKLTEDRIRSVTSSEAVALVRLALSSWHYMHEELREYRDIERRDEGKEAVFGTIFCNYLIWMNYFKLKALQTRFLAVREAGHVAVLGKVQDKFMECWETHSEFKIGVEQIRSSILPRLSVSARIAQVRSGAIVPIILAAVTLTGFAFLQPFAFGTFDRKYADALAAMSYSVGSAATIGNFLFGVWLLLPVEREDNPISKLL